MFLCRHEEIPERRTSRSTQTGGRESTVHVTGRGGPVLRTACANRRESVGSLRRIAAWMTGGKASPTTKNFRSARKTKGVPAPKIIRSIPDRGPATKNVRSAARLRTTSAEHARSDRRRAARARASAGNDRRISEKSYVLPRGLPSFFWTSTNRYFIVKGLFAAAPTNGNNAHSHFYKDISLWA